jgi:hypothetical protein
MRNDVAAADAIFRECAWCAQNFEARTQKARFCSNRCRCACNANKRRVEKRIRRAVEDTLWLVDLYADDPTEELVAAGYHMILHGLSFGPQVREEKE